MIDLDLINPNLLHLAPELSLFIAAFAVIVLDLVARDKRLLAWVSGAGLAIAATLALGLWGERATSFADALIVDELSVFFKLLFLGITFLVVLASQDYVRKFERFQGEYYGLILFACVGMMLVASVGELVSLYIALELQAFSLIALAGFLKDARSAESSVKFLLLSAISTAVMLYGMALLLGATGSTYLTDIAGRTREAFAAGRLADNAPLLLALVFLLVGFGFKIATIPFQMWVPDVYEGAPTPITAYLSVASKAAGFAVLLRVFYAVFGEDTVATDWRMLVAVLAIVSMTVGNVAAIAQQNIKRMLAYSTIAHAGYIMVGLATLTQLGQGSVLFYLVAYSFTNLGAFFAIIAIANRTGSDEIDDFAGMGRQAPFLAFVLGVSLVSLIGLPPTAGFMGKLYVFNAAVQDGLWWLVLAGVLNSVLSAYYYLRPIRVMYLGEPKAATSSLPSLPMRAALAISLGGVILLGILPGGLIDLAASAVRILTA
ncbi:MAG: NADH-quinone oxidoreductase subunit N [Chloroflexi bacterium]|nr:NADH-quinone oxidoreductase subunit N [Chloroflexota bacterium]